jgi:COP9 signalosome complex subunit 1
MAIIEAKKGSDVRNYNQAVALLKRGSIGRNLESLLDPAWATQQEKKNNGETARLENELKGYKNNLIKESIRVCPGIVPFIPLASLISKPDGQ